MGNPCRLGIPYDLDLSRENVINPTGVEPELERSFQLVTRKPIDLVLYHGTAALFASRCAWLDNNPLPANGRYVPAPAARVRLHGYAIRSDHPVADIEIRVNDSRVGCKLTASNDRWFTLEMDPVPRRHPCSELTIRPQFFVPVRYFDPQTTDPRSLSVALARIALHA